jgi:hypothetical protein
LLCLLPEAVFRIARRIGGTGNKPSGKEVNHD